MSKQKILLVLLLLASSAGHSQGDSQPANFAVADEKRRLEQLIEFPEVKGNVTSMLDCFATIRVNGKMRDYACFTKDQYDRPFAAAVAKAAKKARLNPAIINGKKSRIYLQFRTEFIAEGEERNIHLYLNPGYPENIEAYGSHHVAAQRKIGKETWQSACPKRAKFSVWARAYLSAEGVPESPSIVHAAGVLPTETCQNAIMHTILSSAFTPALSEGEPVPSTFVELFGN